MRLLGIYFVVAGCRDLAGLVAQLLALPRWDETSRYMLFLGPGAPAAIIELLAAAILLRKR
jgi:hypothetical protein